MATPTPHGTHVPKDNTSIVCGCGATNTVERRRLPTCYQHEEDNWMTSCLTCYEETRETYDEWIDEYYAGLL